MQAHCSTTEGAARERSPVWITSHAGDSEIGREDRNNGATNRPRDPFPARDGLHRRGNRRL